jgi:hypothetical protein
MQWIESLAGTSKEVSRLNRIAALWTAAWSRAPCRRANEVQPLHRGVWECAVNSEDALAFVEDGTLGDCLKQAYFSRIVPFSDREKAEPIFRMEKIVNVEGDVRRGVRPFPHPFPARMPVEVARAAVSALTKPGDVVMDPMIGSGVVAKAALAVGRKAIGRDVDPLAIVQSRALCAGIAANRLDSLADAVHNSARMNAAIGPGDHLAFSIFMRVTCPLMRSASNLTLSPTFTCLSIAGSCTRKTIVIPSFMSSFLIGPCLSVILPAASSILVT